jgi:hypothetical protein
LEPLLFTSAVPTWPTHIARGLQLRPSLGIRRGIRGSGGVRLYKEGGGPLYLALYVVLYSSTWVLAPDLFMAWPVTRHLWGVKEKARKGDLGALVGLL